MYFPINFFNAQAIKNTIPGCMVPSDESWEVRKELFGNKKDSWLFVDFLKELDDIFHVRVAAYCLMSNHYHFLVQNQNANLSFGSKIYHKNNIDKVVPV